MMPLSNVEKWKQIGASGTVIDWVEHGVLLPFFQLPRPTELPNRKFSAKQAFFLDGELKNLVKNCVIKKCSQKPFVVSPLNVVPKKGKNQWRLIIDLREINSHIEPPKFANENIQVISSIVNENDLFVTLDLKDGFYHVPVAEEHQTYLGFQWKKQYYCWKRLPFGLNASPYFFAKTLKPVLTYVRSHGLRTALYVDDWFLAAQPNNIEDHKTFLISILESLGWTINYKKSSLNPEPSKTWIGYIISSCNQTCDNTRSDPVICIPPDRIRKVRRDIVRALRKNWVQAKALARIAGQCVSLAQVILPAKLLLRNVYRVLASKKTWYDMLTLTTPAREDLKWWLNALNNWNNRSLRKRPVEVQICTDASSSGWGAWLQDRQAAGFWNKRLRDMPSNYRELTAVLMALHSFMTVLKGKSVQIMSDNISTVAYLNHLGGAVQELSDMAKAIWSLAFHNGILISARYLAGKRNVLADRLSRLNLTHEWRLHTKLFKWIDNIWGPHTVDRFATLTNTQLPRYNSRFYDPKSEAVDALAQQNWAAENNYANPPFRLISQVVELIKRQKATATLITPSWPGQVWFQTLKTMSVAKPIVLLTNHRTMWSAGPIPEPLKNPKWKLTVWRVSGADI
jgi:hypothetical protein